MGLLRSPDPPEDAARPLSPCGRGAPQARIRLVRWRRAGSVLDHDRVIEDAVAAFPGPLGQNLLSILMLPQGERAALIGRLHQDSKTRSLAELLIDLEDDWQLALDFPQALQERHAG